MRHWTIALFGLPLLTSLLLHADEKARPTGTEIRVLIDQLASPNPPPITGNEDEREAPEYRLPKGFDKDKQSQVHLARMRLIEIGPLAFPFLVERWGDKRYSMTKSVGINGYCYNATVGDVCQSIVYDQLQPYSFWPETEDDPRGKPKRPFYPGTFLRTPEKAARWCEHNKHRSLYELQLGIVDWVIAEEQRSPGDYIDAERERLQEIRMGLLSTKKPIARGTYDWSDIEL